MRIRAARYLHASPCALVCKCCQAAHRHEDVAVQLPALGSLVPREVLTVQTFVPFPSLTLTVPFVTTFSGIPSLNDRYPDIPIASTLSYQLPYNTPSRRLRGIFAPRV